MALGVRVSSYRCLVSTAGRGGKKPGRHTQRGPSVLCDTAVTPPPRDSAISTSPPSPLAPAVWGVGTLFAPSNVAIARGAIAGGASRSWVQEARYPSLELAGANQAADGEDVLVGGGGVGLDADAKKVLEANSDAEVGPSKEHHHKRGPRGWGDIATADGADDVDVRRGGKQGGSPVRKGFDHGIGIGAAAADLDARRSGEGERGEQGEVWDVYARGGEILGRRAWSCGTMHVSELRLHLACTAGEKDAAHFPRSVFGGCVWAMGCDIHTLRREQFILATMSHPRTMHVHGGFGGPGGEGYGQGTGGPGGIGQGPTLHMERVENLYTGGQKEAEIWDQMEDTKRRTIIEWLSPLNFFLRQQDISKTRQQGTGEWLLDDPKFKSWKSNPGQVLWCSGILEHLTDQSKNKNIGVACIYFNHKETQIQTLDNLLAGLWRQLIWKKPLGSAVQLYEQHIEKQTRPSHEDMQKILSSVLIWFTQVYFILDGVDEYPAEWWSQLAKALTNLGPVQESERLSELIADKPELHGEISSKICSSVEGMFLLAKLHIEALSKTATIKAVRQALQNLPKDLDATYENVMTRINAQVEEDRKIARSTLTWVVNARRPLTSLELCVALAIEPETRELDNDNMTGIGIILSVCGGLVIVEDHSSLVRLVHFTAQSYLDRIQTEIFPDAHFEITLSLLTYLQFEQFSDKKAISRDKGSQLLEYCQYCLVHAQQCEGQLKDEILGFLREAREWQEQQWKLELWDHPPWNFDDWPDSPSPLWVASSANLVETASHLIELAQKCPDSQELTVAAYYSYQKICELLLNKGADVNAQGGRYGNALQAAASQGHDKIVQVLLDKGADVNAHGGEYGNALQAAAFGGHDKIVQAAAFGGHDKIVQVLLDKGVDVNAQGGEYGNALQAAAFGGHDKIVQVLLDKGVDVNAQGGLYGNALQAAASGGHEKIVQVLLDKGADVNRQGGEYGNALRAAASGGHDKIVQVLLDKGADVNAQGGEYGNALRAAASGGHDKIVQVLLDKGADVNAQGGEYGNALRAAASGGHDKIVQVLLDKGADANAQGGNFGNALQAAAFGGHDKIVQVLLDKGVDVNAQGGLYGNALQAAASGGHEKIVQVLLDKGADMNRQGGEYGNALRAAASGGHDKIVQVLLDKGADVNAQGGEYGNALRAAASGGHDKIVQVLLDKGADVNAQGGEYGNALRAAASGGHDKIVQVLLDKGADANAQGGNFGNALQAAAFGGHDKIVQVLLDKGVDVNAQGGYFGNALQAAAYRGHDKIVQVLLDKGADVNAQGGSFGNALQVAAYRRHDKIVQVLLDKGADVNPQGGNFGNVLQAAAFGGHDKIVQALLDKGADVNAQGGHFGNALQPAAYRRHDKIVQVLLDRGADVNAQGGEYGNALQAAAFGGHDKIVQVLLDKGANVNAQGGYFGNALQAAAYGGHDKIVQVLLDKGADVNAQGGEYKNALQAAASGGHDKIVQVLLDKGVDVNAQEGFFGNALQAAASEGHDKIVQGNPYSGSSSVFSVVLASGSIISPVLGSILSSNSCSKKSCSLWSLTSACVM
ncbi:ankyrin repeat-containing domain protein [Mycena olivaceomarginata]|nr:ankyrin repeat-containing domain protein [Mycena olivaceomarginata]